MTGERMEWLWNEAFKMAHSIIQRSAPEVAAEKDRALYHTHSLLLAQTIYHDLREEEDKKESK